MESGDDKVHGIARADVERYVRIHQGLERYGSGTRSDQATAFYLKHLVKPAVEQARLVSDRPPTKVDLLVSLSGFTPTPAILAYELLEPERMVVIASEAAQRSIDVIHYHAVQPGGRLRPSQFRAMDCDPTDPMSIYRIVKEELDRLVRASRSKPYAIIDITGGRKVMSAAAALAAWQLKLDLAYMEGEFDQNTRHPIPGTDRMMILDDPNIIFGEQEMSRALEMFRAGAFEAARHRYEEICDSIVVPVHARFMRGLSEMYRAWCDLDMEALPEAVESVRQTIGNVRRTVGADYLDTLEQQVAFVRRLVAGDRDAMALCFFVLGLHYQEIGRRDFAALLYYRTIESCLTRRIHHRFGGLDPDRPDWGLLGDATAAKRRYSALAHKMGWHNGPPPKLMLIACAVLLAAERDAYAEQCGFHSLAGLRRLQDLTRVRNHSVLAHGFEAIGKEQTEALRDRAKDMLTAFWTLHGEDRDLDLMLADLRFLRADR
ncbi:hypothetical protein ACTOB_003315 [Actinoplanes oblitus]|uniref:CRISPR-associated protein n=1 Tax=Actinoplanes oblitus TaxID=3040509 RepID=A0ABY8WP77_9ACTN|nr:hypothetical protein [Actinoplanes oblitus]WIM99655.1 hypothetical protein ACTOB_003315 [Actinoplanes oblitus]